MVHRLIGDAGEPRLPADQSRRGCYMRYDGVTMMATKRMANNWQGVFSLVLSKSEGRLGSSARVDADQRAEQPGRDVRPRRGRAQRLRQHRRPA